MRLINNTYHHQNIHMTGVILNEKQQSYLFRNSNKCARKIESMLDIINFTLFDFELMYERYGNSPLDVIFKDIIAYLKSSKHVINQESIKDLVNIESCESTYKLAVYAALEAIDYFLNQNYVSDHNFNDELQNMKISLKFAIK